MRLLNSVLLTIACSLCLCGQGVESTTVLTATGTTPAIRTNALNHTVQVNITGTATACSVQLEGSLDGTNWANLSGPQACTTSPTMFHVDGKTLSTVRINLTAFTGATSATLIYKGSN